MRFGVYKRDRGPYNWGYMSNEVVTVEAPRQSSQDRLLAMIQKRHPDYHPVLAMVEIAVEQRQAGEDGDAGLEFACHKEVAKYVVQVDKFVEVKQELKQTKRVIVELFSDQAHPDRQIVEDVTDVLPKNDAASPVGGRVLGPDDPRAPQHVIQERVRKMLDERSSVTTVVSRGPLEAVWGDGAEADAAGRFT